MRSAHMASIKRCIPPERTRCCLTPSRRAKCPAPNGGRHRRLRGGGPEFRRLPAIPSSHQGSLHDRALHAARAMLCRPRARSHSLSAVSCVRDGHLAIEGPPGARAIRGHGAVRAHDRGRRNRDIAPAYPGSLGRYRDGAGGRSGDPRHSARSGSRSHRRRPANPECPSGPARHRTHSVHPACPDRVRGYRAQVAGKLCQTVRRQLEAWHPARPGRRLCRCVLGAAAAGGPAVSPHRHRHRRRHHRATVVCHSGDGSAVFPVRSISAMCTPKSFVAPVHWG
jgi:hypothetical protein